MYIFRNALRNINRSKGRNILIGVIVFVIAVSACVALSIRQAAETEKEDYLSDMKITASISVDRQSLMEKAKNSSGSSSPADMKSAFSGVSSLSLTELQKYAKASSVSGFYYTLTTYLDASSIEAVSTSGSGSSASSASSTDTSTDTSSDQDTQSKGGPGGGAGMMGSSGDFTVIGYSSDDAMTDFTDGTSKITKGSMFEEGTSEYQCVISEELAEYNSLSVGDTITLVNPSNSAETVTLTVTGIYSTTDTGNSGGGPQMSDPANEIYMSYAAVKAMTDASAVTNADDTSNKLTASLNGTYVFDSESDYSKFEKQASSLGLSDDYTVSSSDLTSFEQSIEPLENLSKYAMYFLIVVMIVGGVVLAVINVFNIRDRKYEIGVLAAIGMKKKKIAAQFITEILIVTLACTLIGAAVGAGISVPVTNSLLASQVSSSQEQESEQSQNFERPDSGSAPGSSSSSGGSSSSDKKSVPGNGGKSSVNYITKVSTAANWKVIAEIAALGLLLSLISASAAIIFVMRYDPLKIISDRE